MFVNATRLLGKNNPFKDNKIFASLPIMGNAIAILPEVDLKVLIEQLETLERPPGNCFESAITTLPANNGIAIRVLASKTRDIKQYFSLVLKQIRYFTQQTKLPYIPK